MGEKIRKFVFGKFVKTCRDSITEPKMIELIENEIMDNGTEVRWDEIAGLEFVKTTVKEIVVFPLLRPDIFHGLRAPPKAS